MGGFDGNGNYQRYFNWQQDAANGVNITASRVDTEDNGFAAGLTNCVTRDGQGKMGADLTPATDNTFNLGTMAARWASLNGISLAFLIPLNARKSTDLARTASSIVTDPDLQIPIAGSGSFSYEMVLNVWGTTSTNQGILLNPAFSGSISNMFSRLDYASSGGLSIGGNGVFIVNDLAALASTGDVMGIRGTFTTTSAGTFSLSWGTHAANGNPANIGTGSYLTVRQIA